MPLAPILLFLRANWIPISIGVACLALMGYIKVLHMEIDHYKGQVVELKQVIQKNAETEEQLQIANKGLTEKYKQALKNQFAMQDSQGQIVAERIKKNEASKHIPLDAELIGLFNGLKPAPPAAPTAVRGDAPNPSPDQEAVVPEKTLNDLLQVAAYNDNNHAKCIAQVQMWQEFWKDYEMNYKAIVPQ